MATTTYLEVLTDGGVQSFTVTDPIVNPWIQGHVEAEMAHTGREYPRKMAVETVLGEYKDRPETYPCPCGGTRWYRGTIGAWQCPDCRELAPVTAPRNSLADVDRMR